MVYSVIGVKHGLDELSVVGEKYNEEQKELLLAHGAELFIDGFNPKTGKIEETYENGNSY